MQQKYALETYGEDLFYKTKPVLLVKNETTKECFEIEINDFANNWYITVPNAKCKYRVELLRKPIENKNNSNYIYMASSNLIEAPNDHVLLEKLPKTVMFYDIKSKTCHAKNVDFTNNENKSVENIYSFYKDIKKEDFINNPSSLNSIY